MRTTRRVVAKVAGSVNGAQVEREDISPATITRVVLPLAAALVLGNVDRICMSVAIIPMASEFGWPSSVQGLVQSAFLWGYTITQLLGGSLADRHGGKMVLGAGVLWFSAASALLPLTLTPATAAAGLALPLAMMARCMVGLGEGVVLPSMNNLVASHVAALSRSRALGLTFCGYHSGNLLGLLLSPLLLAALGWRGLFLALGSAGIPLTLWWHLTVPSSAAPTPLPPTPSDPQEPRTMQPTEATSLLRPGDEPAHDGAALGSGGGLEGGVGEGAAEEEEVTVWAMVKHPATWGLLIAAVVNNWGFFILLNWLPTYFHQALGMDLRTSAALTFLPWAVMAVCSPSSGFVADHLISRGTPVAVVRRCMQGVAFVVPALMLLLLSSVVVSPQVAAACMAVALGANAVALAGYVANMSDVAPRHAGKMFGLCNTFGSLAGMVGVAAVGYVLEATGSFTEVFQLTAVVYALGAIAFTALCSGEAVF